MTSAVSGVGSGSETLAQSAAGVATTSTKDNSALSPDAFLKLMVAQLQYQDPSKPVDTASFMQETATLSQVQTSQTMADNNTAMLTATNNQTASNLVGKSIVYNTGAKDSSGVAVTATGTVTSATISGKTPVLNIGTTQVDLTDVQQVLAAGASATTSTGTSTAGTGTGTGTGTSTTGTGTAGTGSSGTGSTTGG